MLWRMRAEPALMKIASDPDIRGCETLEKAVRRDIHKMRAFVRFRPVGDGADERYVAWFEPEHFIVERNAPFFVRRFTGMRWTILTPYALRPIGTSPKARVLARRRQARRTRRRRRRGAWLTYYENIFNPARLKTKAMQKEMPKKYWRNLPEASLIPDLVAGADKRRRGR